MDNITAINGTTFIVMADEGDDLWWPVASAEVQADAITMALSWGATAQKAANLSDEAERVRLLNLLPGAPAVPPVDYRVMSVPSFKKREIKSTRRKRKK